MSPATVGAAASGSPFWLGHNWHTQQRICQESRRDDVGGIRMRCSVQLQHRGTRQSKSLGMRRGGGGRGISNARRRVRKRRWQGCASMRVCQRGVAKGLRPRWLQNGRERVFAKTCRSAWQTSVWRDAAVVERFPRLEVGRPVVPAQCMIRR